MLVSSVWRSYALIPHNGFCQTSDDVYSLWDVMPFWATNQALNFVQQFEPPPSLPLGWSQRVQKLVSIFNEFSHCDAAWWWLLLYGLLWIPIWPAQRSHFTWHHHQLSQAPSTSSCIGDEFNKISKKLETYQRRNFITRVIRQFSKLLVWKN